MFDNASERDSVSDSARSQAPQGRTLPLSGDLSAVPDEQTNVLAMLAELEELPDRAHGLFGKRILFGFDHSRFSTLVLKIRANLPQDVKSARDVVRNRARIVGSAREQADRLITEARTEAERIVDDARRSAEAEIARGAREAERMVEDARLTVARMIDETEVMRMARQEANDFVSRAEAEAAEIREGANKYARDVLANLEQYMSQALAVIHRGQQVLEEELGRNTGSAS